MPAPSLPLRAAFITCVSLGLACIQEILDCGGTLAAVITLPDSKAPNKSGRIYLDDFCSAYHLPLHKFDNVNDEACLTLVRQLDLDWLFIIGWSQIAREPLLQAVKRGVIGIHPTLLPQGRGRAAIPWAILKGLTETGVTLFKLDTGVDTGPILLQERIPIAPDETATILYERIAHAHRHLIRRAWPGLVANTIQPVPQTGPASVWPGRTPADGCISQTMTVQEIDQLVRATTSPYPGAFLHTGTACIRIWAGHPVMTQPAPPQEFGTYRITAVDGFFDATDFQLC